MLYYHGTDKDFDQFDLNMALPQKDFGAGMYLSQEQWHAERVARAKNGEHVYIRVYDVNMEELRRHLNVRVFKKTSVDWVKYVEINRNSIVDSPYDIVIGATADAAAQKTLEAFHRKHRTRTASPKEYRELISSLSVHRYPIQMAALTQKAINYLENECYAETFEIV